MGGVANSLGGFMGLSDGPKAPGAQNYSAGIDQLNQMNNGAAQGGDILNNYAQGNISSADALNEGQNRWGATDPFAAMGLQNALATGATTGSKYATEQVQNNPILGSLFGKGGQLEGAEGRLNDLQSQGFQLKPEDYDLYGQTSGNIARMFGSQGNQISQDLANRGLAAGPSGSATAMFSGLNGNQNEMLAQAQQQIMQQRFANTQNQIQQQQGFISSLGQQAGNDINQQFGRQLQGAQNQTQNESAAGQLQTGANAQANNANMASANFNQENKPANFMDFATAGVGQRLKDIGSGNNGNAGLFGQAS